MRSKEVLEGKVTKKAKRKVNDAKFTFSVYPGSLYEKYESRWPWGVVDTLGPTSAGLRRPLPY